MNKSLLLVWMCVLTSMAGALNAISIFGYNGTTISHVTGLVSKFAISIQQGSLNGAWDVLRIILMFLVGTIISGIITGERAFYLHKRYGFIILAIGVLVIIPYFLPVYYSVLAFAFIMGLQNGMVVSFKGVVVRMTHMSGNVTDLGVYIGYKIRGNKNEKLQTGIIPLVALISFTLGGILGVLLYTGLKNNAFFIISGIYILSSIFYFVFRHICNDRDFNGIPDHLESKTLQETNE